MIVLDTNVVSEPMKPDADPAVLSWLDAQVAETLYLTATSLAELLIGIEVLPSGQRKAGLGAMLADLLANLFEGRILPFDHATAAAYAPLMASARFAGRTISLADGQIAAIATTHGFAVATRDTAPFMAMGVPIIDPWSTSAT